MVEFYVYHCAATRKNNRVHFDRPVAINSRKYHVVKGRAQCENFEVPPFFKHFARIKL